MTVASSGGKVSVLTAAVKPLGHKDVFKQIPFARSLESDTGCQPWGQSYSRINEAGQTTLT